MAAAINPDAKFPNLETIVARWSLWPTPRASTLEGRGNSTRKPGTGGKILNEEAEKWARLWRAPTAGDGEGGIMDIAYARRNGMNPKLKLRDDAANWPTPQAWDAKGYHAKNPEKVSTPSRPDQGQPTIGGASSPPDPTSDRPSPPRRMLNWRFVIWLMGFPQGWLGCPGGPGCGCSATPSCPPKSSPS